MKRLTKLILPALSCLICANPSSADYNESRVQYARGTFRLFRGSNSECPPRITVAVDTATSPDSFNEIVITAVPQGSEELSFSQFSIPRDSINKALRPTREYSERIPLRKITQNFGVTNSTSNHKNLITVQADVELILDRQMNKLEFPSSHEFQINRRGMNYFYSVWTGNEPAEIANEHAACQYDRVP
jgi:hypothetical protein